MRGRTLGDDESDAKHPQRIQRVKEKVQNGSTLKKVKEWARDVGQDGLVPSRETVMASSNHSGPVMHTGANGRNKGDNDAG